jgi:hypothetical protein
MNKPDLDNEFPSLRAALDGLYVTFYVNAGAENQESRCGDIGLPRLSGEADLNSIMANVLRLQEIERHKYILPRVLALLAEEVVDSADYAWVIINKVAAYWRDWSHDERIAIHVFMRAWWRATLSRFPRRLDVYEFFSIVSIMQVDIRPYLSYWARRADGPAMRHLAWLVMDFTVHSASNDRWYETLDTWVSGVEPSRMLEDALSAGPDVEVAREFSAARDVLRSWGASSQ